MFDFAKEITFEEFKQGAFEGFLLSCPDEPRQHILLCVRCQQSLDPLFRQLYDAMVNDNIVNLVKKINEDIIDHIKEHRKINRNWLGKLHDDFR